MAPCGNNLGNSIFAKSGNGVVSDGAIRDLEGLEEVEGFNAFLRGRNPTSLNETMLAGINVPIRIGQATVLLGEWFWLKEKVLSLSPLIWLKKW